MRHSMSFEGKKFMWDGVEYPGEDDAAKGMAKYGEERFETRLVKEDDKFYVFTRRVVTEIKLEGAPPA